MVAKLLFRPTPSTSRLTWQPGQPRPTSYGPFHWGATSDGTLVAHEPPLVALLEDFETAIKVNADIVDTYQRNGFGPAMAKIIQLVMHVGPLADDYLNHPAPDPAQFGLPTEDDGSRDDPLLAHNLAMPPYRPDADALRATGVRIVPAIGAVANAHPPRRTRFARLVGPPATQGDNRRNPMPTRTPLDALAPLASSVPPLRRGTTDETS